MAIRNPLAAWRGGTHWPMLLIGVLVAAVAALAVFEALGWPFLVEPLQNAASKALGRQVTIGAGNQNSGAASSAGNVGPRIGLLGSVRLHAPRLEIARPDWSEAPHMLLAQDAFLKVGYLDLWRAWRGERLNLAAVEATTLDAHLERREDGRASWQFGTPQDQKRKQDKPEDSVAALPTFGALNVGAGHVDYRDAVLPARIDASFALRDSSGANNASTAALKPAESGARQGFDVKAGGRAENLPQTAPRVELAPGERGFIVKAVGRYQKLPLLVDFQTNGALSLLGDGDKAQAQPVRVAATVGKTELGFDGSTTDPLHLSALKGNFSVAGPSLDALGDTLGITLPATPSFKTNGQLVKDAAVWKAVFEKATIGASRLEGAFTYDSGLQVPLLSGRLGGSKLVLADLGPAIGAPPADGDDRPRTGGRGRVFPDKKFDLPSLRAMNANLLIDIAEFDTGTDVLATLKPMRAHLLLAEGVLTLADLEASTAKGRLIGSLQLDGRGNRADWKADLGLRGVDLEQWLQIKRAGNDPPYVVGLLDAKVDVAGSGRSTAEILGSLHGRIRAHLRNAALSHLAVEAVGVDVAQALGVLVKGDDLLRIQCNVIDLAVERGLVKPKMMILNTSDSTIWIDGIVSLKTEAMGLRVAVAPKDFSPLTLRTPIDISGTLSSPKVSVEASRLAGKAAAAGLLSLLNPLAAVIPFIDTGSGDEAKKAGADCAAAAKRGGAIAVPAKQPKNTPVPAAAVRQTEAKGDRSRVAN